MEFLAWMDWAFAIGAMGMALMALNQIASLKQEIKVLTDELRRRGSWSKPSASGMSSCLTASMGRCRFIEAGHEPLRSHQPERSREVRAGSRLDRRARGTRQAHADRRGPLHHLGRERAGGLDAPDRQGRNSGPMDHRRPGVFENRRLRVNAALTPTVCPRERDCPV